MINLPNKSIPGPSIQYVGPPEGAYQDPLCNMQDSLWVGTS